MVFRFGFEGMSFIYVIDMIFYTICKKMQMVFFF